MSMNLKQNKRGEQSFNPFTYVDFSKASPEAIDAILTALNAEVDEAVAEERFPTIDGAFGRLAPTSAMMM